MKSQLNGPLVAGRLVALILNSARGGCLGRCRVQAKFSCHWPTVAVAAGSPWTNCCLASGLELPSECLTDHIALAHASLGGESLE